ncbi:MAG: hypothetical protein L6R42_006267 [Xanthoria sp. 1 TBL-2021]|nr:MAG: hypothetical protein L6R42_006267 [Xanthoria sp. 1 TBL-2021]
MSFFKKMVDGFEDLMGEDHHKSSHNQNGQQGQLPSACTEQLSFSTLPATHSNPTGGPSLPPGWVVQWDPNSWHYYLVEQATGRSQWEPPQQFKSSHGGFPPSGGPPPLSSPCHGSHDAHRLSGAYYSHTRGWEEVYKKKEEKSGKTGMLHKKKEKKSGKAGMLHKKKEKKSGKAGILHKKKEKKNGKAGMLAAGAGGLAVGAVGGAMIRHAIGTSVVFSPTPTIPPFAGCDFFSNDEHYQSYQQQSSYVQQTTYYQEDLVETHEDDADDASDRESSPSTSNPNSVLGNDDEDLAEQDEEDDSDHRSVSSGDEDLAEVHEDDDDASDASDRVPSPPDSDRSSISSSDKEDLAEAGEDDEINSDASHREEASEDAEEQDEETYGSD